MFETYLQADAEKLISFYKPLLLGKMIDQKTKYKITNVSAEPFGPNKYRVNANAKHDMLSLRREISKVATEYKLRAPADVLERPCQ